MADDLTSEEKIDREREYKRLGGKKAHFWESFMDKHPKYLQGAY